MKENLDASRPNVKFTFVNQDDEGKTMLNILNPDTGSGRDPLARSKATPSTRGHSLELDQDG